MMLPMEEDSKRPSLVVSLSLGHDLAARLEAEVERLQKERPWVSWSRNAVIRMALETHFASADSQ